MKSPSAAQTKWKVEKTTSGLEPIVLLHRPNDVPIVVARGGLCFEMYETLNSLIQSRQGASDEGR